MNKKGKIRNKIPNSKLLLNNEIFFKNYLSLKKSLKKNNLDVYSFLLKRTNSFIIQNKNKNYFSKNLENNILFKIENSINEYDKNYFKKKEIYNSIKNDNENNLIYYKFIKSKSQEYFLKSKKINLPEFKFDNLFKNNPLILKKLKDLNFNVLNENAQKSNKFLKKIENLIKEKIFEINNNTNEQIFNNKKNKKNSENEKINENCNKNFKKEIKDFKKNIKKNKFLLDKINKNKFLFNNLILSPSNSKNLIKTSSTFFSLNNTQKLKNSLFSPENKKNNILIIDSNNNNSFNNKKEENKMKIIKNKNSSILKRNNLTPSNKEFYKTNNLFNIKKINNNDNNKKLSYSSEKIYKKEIQNKNLTNNIKNLNENNNINNNNKKNHNININDLYKNLKDNPEINGNNFFKIKKYFDNNHIKIDLNKTPFNLLEIINNNIKRSNYININKISKDFLKFGKILPKSQKLFEKLNETNTELKELSDSYIKYIIDFKLKND